jgi:hypothetical protein
MPGETSAPVNQFDSTPARSGRRTSQLLVACLAVVGVVAVGVQVWGYTAWLLSPGFATIASPASPPKSVGASVIQAQWISVAAVVLWLAYVVWDWRRRRGLTWPVLWTVAWALVLWQEPLVNVRDRTFSFNKEFVNRGDWTTYLPFVPHAFPLPEALLLEGPVFVYLLPLVAVGTAALMRVGHRYLRISGLVVLVAWLAVGLFDMLFERAGIAEGLLAYPQLGGPAIDRGQPSQWPVCEGIAIGLVWALPGMVMFFRRYARDPARRELVPRWWHGRNSAPVTLLAAVGLVNLAFGLYNAGYALIMSGTVATMQPWL